MLSRPQRSSDLSLQAWLASYGTVYFTELDAVLGAQIWIILYGQVQSWSPHWLLRPLKQSPPNKWVAVLWAGILVICPVIMSAVLLGSDVYGPGADKGRAVAVMTVVLYLFCLIFAVNSAVHRYVTGHAVMRCLAKPLPELLEVARVALSRVKRTHLRCT